MNPVRFTEKSVFTIFKGVRVWPLVLAAALILGGGTAYGEETATQPAVEKEETTTASNPKKKADLGELGHKLSNPASDVWAIFTEFDLSFFDGDINQGDSKVGGRMIFQPILPFPLYGRGDDEWKWIARPTIPVIFHAPVPKGYDDFNTLGGLGDIQIPTLVVPAKNLTGNWAFGLGPTWVLPTASRDEFAADQWGVGPAVFTGYSTKKWLAGALFQYHWRFAGWNDEDTPDLSSGSLLYYFTYNLADAWQVGMSPTITYDDNATSGNKWNVPVGLYVSKMVSFGSTPVKLQFGMEYSVVSPDDFGQQFQFKINIIPVIPGLVQNPIFGK